LALLTKKLAKWFKKPAEPTEKEMIKNFIQELDSVLVSMEEMTEDMTIGFSNQVIQQRPLSTKLIAYLPKFMQSKHTRSQNEKLFELKTTKQKMQILRGTLSKIDESIDSMDLRAAPLEGEEVGNRIYEIAFPGEAINSKNVGTLEERLQMLENSFLASMDQINGQMNQISSNLLTLTHRLEEQGVKIDRIDEKITDVQSKLQKIQSTLTKISRKLTQNRTLLALLAGSVIALVIVIVIL
jgi:chromosome segregation ATPase